ncbi:MAG: phosphoadenosine phosphosulfate reductase family protein [Oscillospiraceae bacterium]|nr:phosphoadenosine phosphosulfate reductase family protein [Oscillospiraceae bacterium]
MTKTNENSNYHALSLSGGKDSSALLLLMIEKGLPIDCVLYADTGMEFPEIEAHIARLDDLFYRERGIHITTLRHPHGFEWMMFDTPINQERAIARRIANEQPLAGYGWPSMQIRWCTGQLKTHLIQKEVNRLKKEKCCLHYIGIAADEAHRCKDEPRNRYPLVEWGITEAQALQICYDRGYDFGGLYEIYHRASCWCCPLQRIQNLRKLRRHHPELWARLRDMDDRARAQFGPGPLGQFKQNWSVERLEERFAKEEAQH